MQVIKSNEIENALEHEYRQYLTGHLGRPQPYLTHIDDDIEIGISFYREFTADTPHQHPKCTEHAYILEGKVRLMILDGDCREYEFGKGDFFVIPPATPYAAKNAPNTRVLFIKSPGVNDKEIVTSLDDPVKKWLASWDRSTMD